MTFSSGTPLPSVSAALNVALRETTYSFRAPTPQELAAAQPYRVRVVEVGRGVNTADLIAAMALPEMKADWFEALNGIAPSDPVRAGQKVKIVK